MLPAARARELVAGMLAAGARNASEIIAASQGANISARTFQRASRQLGVVKTKDGRGGWTWRLPVSGEDSGPGLLKDVKVTGETDTARARTLATRLRKLEGMRGKAAPIHAGDPRLLRWVAAGISDPDLREAYERAVSDLEGDGPVTVGHLDRFVVEVLAESSKAQAAQK